MATAPAALSAATIAGDAAAASLPATIVYVTVSGDAAADTGGVGPEPRVWRISWGALPLETDKSPTEVPPGRRLPVAPPSAISEFASSSSPS